jgi:hypothetical protein
MGDERRSLTVEEEREVLTQLRAAWGASLHDMIFILLVNENSSDATQSATLVIQYLTFLATDNGVAKFKKDFARQHAAAAITQLGNLYLKHTHDNDRSLIPNNIQDKLHLLAADDSPFKELARKACQELAIAPPEHQPPPAQSPLPQPVVHLLQ